MLQFFRKYQRFFFLIVTVVIIFSFSFFGTYSAFTSPSAVKKKDKVVGSYLNGAKMHQSEIKRLSHFITYDAEGVPSSQTTLNLLNDNVIRKDFLETGLGALLAKEYFEIFKPKLADSLQRMKRYVPYQHPDAPFINATSIWERFAPGLYERLNAIKAQEAFTPDTFSILAELYLQQSAFPSHSLKRILAYQQKQLPNIPFDQRLYHDDLNLFGFQSIADWFSSDFVDLASEFILNTAIVAEEKGYKISEEVAREHMFRILQANAERLFSKESVNLTELLQRQLQILGLDEKGAVKIWQTLLVFRGFLESSCSGVLLDPLPFKEFGAYAKEKATVLKYDLPKSLQLTHLKDLFQLQFYIKAVGGQKNDPLDLPKTFLPVSEVQKQYPELIKRRYLIDIAEVSLAEVGLKVKVKEMWEWQLEEKNWSLLQKEFPVLSNAKNRKERFEAIKNLTEEIRTKVDNFSVEKMVRTHPEWIQETLAKKPLKTQEITLFPYSNQKILPGIQDGAKLMDFLEKSASDKDALNSYSEDQKNYFRIVVQKKADQDELLLFEEAKALQILDLLLEEHLTKEYPKVRNKAAKKFQATDGSWKSLEEVKDDVGLLVFADLIKAIEGEARGCSLDQNKEDLAAFYLRHRFCAYFRNGKDALVKDPNNTSWLANGEVKDHSSFSTQPLPLDSQWNLIQKSVTLTRQNDDFQNLGLASLQEGSWSDVKTATDGLCFFFVKEKTFEEAVQSKELSEKLLMNEAKRSFGNKLLKIMKAKSAIALPLLQEQDKESSADV